MSGCAARSFCTIAVASASGGVHTSSTTSSMPLAASSFSRRGLKKKTVAAVLSPTIAAFLIGLLFFLARSVTRSSACSACTDDTGEVSPVRHRKPRPLQPLGALRDAERERREPRADARADLFARQHTLRRAHR